MMDGRQAEKPRVAGRSAGRRSAFDIILLILLLLLATGVSLVVVIAWPPLGLSLLIGGVAIVFRRRLGRIAVGVTLLLLGVGQMAVVVGLPREHDLNGEEVWVQDARRNPCSAKDALLLAAFVFMAAGGGVWLMPSGKVKSKAGSEWRDKRDGQENI